tara:strand:+ start:150 stop:431 length:282 start_codon:yes stop_codon:yes gene_type:complete
MRNDRAFRTGWSIIKGGSYDAYNEGPYEDHQLGQINEDVWGQEYKNDFLFDDLHFEWSSDNNNDLVQGIYILESNELLEKRVYTTEQFLNAVR